MATRKRDRMFALFMAVLFLVTTSAFTAAVVWNMVSDKDKSDTAANSSQRQRTTLQGTKLSDFTPVSKVDNLQIIDTVAGNGLEAKAGDTVTVDYTGAVAATGLIFQSSKDAGQPATLSLDQVIEGWKQGIPGMKVNGTRRLLIPANLAYGANPPSGSGIPPNADLVFDVTLHAIGE
jgi:FKBP-type peptidyl-prolyl cis-trans isomerase FkpA